MRHVRTVAIFLLLALSSIAGETFQPGEIVLVNRLGEVVEARVLKQDAQGVLILHKHWQDGTFHEDGHREYRRPEDLRRKGGAGSPGVPTNPPPARPTSPGAPSPPSPPPAAPKGVDARVLPPGDYGCYTYNPKAIRVGTIAISGDGYRSGTGASGRYRGGPDGRVDFLGEAPLGFALGVLEEVEPPKIRLYRGPGDIGSKWKAAVCTRTGGNEPAPRPAGPSGTYAAGEHVEANFLGYWYGATVVRCEGERCLLRYDDPKSKDEWVDTTRLRRR